MALEVRAHQWLVVLALVAAACGPESGGMTSQEGGSGAAASASSSSGSGSSSGVTSSSSSGGSGGSGFTCTGDFPNGCWTCTSAYETASSCGPGSASGSSSSSSGGGSGSSGSGSSSSSSGVTSSGGSGFTCTGDFPNGCWTCTSAYETASGCGPGSSSSSSSSGGPSVERIPPVTQSTVEEGTYVGAFDVGFTCFDAGSGCAGTRYTIRALDGVETDHEYTGPVHLTETCMVKGYSTDLAGNAEGGWWLRFEVLPDRRAQHFRIGDGTFRTTASWTAGRLVETGVIQLRSRFYLDQRYAIGDDAMASVVHGVARAITGAGRPLPVIDPPGDSAQSGAILSLSTFSHGIEVDLYAAPGVVPPFPLRIHTAGPTAAYPAAPPSAAIELPDVPMLIGFARGWPGKELRFTGPLVRGSAGPFDRLVVDPGAGLEACRTTIPRDSPMLSFARGPDRWHDQVRLRPDAKLSACLASASAPLLRFEWDDPAAGWFEAAPFSPVVGFTSPPFWTVELTLRQ
jgi:hypothetical protein